MKIEFMAIQSQTTHNFAPNVSFKYCTHQEKKV